MEDEESLLFELDAMIEFEEKEERNEGWGVEELIVFPEGCGGGGVGPGHGGTERNGVK